MNIYRDGSSVIAAIKYIDGNGNAIEPVNVSYVIYDEERTEIVSQTVVALAAGDTEASITVDGLHNVLGEEEDRILRVVEITMTTVNSEKFTNTFVYIIEVSDTLDVMWNSYQTYEQALLNSMNIANLPGWEAATEQKRKSALAEAFHLLGKLSYKDIDDLNAYDDAAFLELDETFQYSIRLAQIAEADNLLGGNSLDEQRRNGLMASSIGEVSQMYRSGKPVIMPVCTRALRLLTGFIKFGMNIGRS